METNKVNSWVKSIFATTLAVEDLESTKKFYQEIFELPIDFEDPSSAVFNFGNTLINLLKITEAPELILPESQNLKTGQGPCSPYRLMM